MLAAQKEIQQWLIRDQLGGNYEILLLEATDLNHAIQLMSKHPGVRIGPFEIRPADERINAMVAA